MEFHNRTKFWWKTGLLLATTLALIPILLWKSELGATIYLWVLAVIHVGGLFVVGIGAKVNHIAPDKRGLWSRIAGIVTLIFLLYLVSKGLQTSAESWIFWGSLFMIWALHTIGLLLIHLRTDREAKACPFV